MSHLKIICLFWTTHIFFLIPLKLNVDILEIYKVPRGLNSLESKVNKLDVHKLKLTSTGLKKVSDIVDKEVAKKQIMMLKY